MIKRYCDRCGKEVPALYTTELSQLNEYGGLIRKEVQVCGSCRSYIKRAVDSYNIASAKLRVAFCETLMICPEVIKND